MNSRESWERTATLEREQDQERPEAAMEMAKMEMAQAQMKSSQRGAGIRDIIAGAVLIGIGLAMGGSVFTGDADALDWLFDILGSFWILKGVYTLVR